MQGTPPPLRPSNHLPFIRSGYQAIPPKDLVGYGTPGPLAQGDCEARSRG